MDESDENELHAYVDGQADATARASFESRLAGDPLLAQMAEAYAKQNAALHAVYDPVLREPVPAALRRRPRSRAQRILWQAAAAVLLLAIGTGIGWGLARNYAAGGSALAGWPEDAAVAHATYAPEVRHPVEVGAPQEDHLVAWLSKRLGVPIKAPVLTEVGFTLMGGRLLPDTSTPAAQFMYEDAQGRRVTLYLRINRQRPAETAFRWVQDGNVVVCYWVDGTIGYALAGEMGRSELLKVAKVIYRELEG
ncbi:MAG TPA: anti-sigma factor [Candidatus Sulfotelmatobacter sp.]|nr:anti-sigma factor [Candidatus Sulfotelmatobacter sp.]